MDIKYIFHKFKKNVIKYYIYKKNTYINNILVTNNIFIIFLFIYYYL